MAYSHHLRDIELYPFQERGVEFAFNSHYCIIGDEMGLGKTLQGLTLALEVGKNTLIICPAYLRKTWEYEIQKYAKRRDLVVTTFDKQGQVYTPIDEDIIITSYSMLIDCEELFEWADLVIGDEIHYVKNMEAGRGDLFHKFLFEQEPERFLGLSGTPIKNDVTEWYSLLALCSYSPKETNGLNVMKGFPESKLWNRFFAYSRHIAIGGGRFIEKFSGIRNKRRLRDYLRGKYIRREAKDHLELPDLVRKDIIVNYRDNRELERAWDTFNSGKATDSSAKAKSALVKATFTARYCKDIHEWEGSPVLIFTDHIDSCERIAKELKKSEIIQGSTPIEKRDEIVRRFQKGLIPYLVATIGAAQAGYTLTAASNVVFNDLSWVPAHNWQAEKRIHRIGQKRACTVHRMMGSRQDDKIKAILDDKIEAIKEAL